MKLRAVIEDINPPALWAGISTFIFMVFGALTLQLSVIRSMGLAEDVGSSWVFITWLSAGLVSLPFILRYRQPLAIGWTIPGLVYMASLAGRFTFEEMVAANIITGLAIVALGLGGIGSRIIHLIPLPILMAMFAGSLIAMLTQGVDATKTSPLVIGAMAVAYLAARAVNNPRLPPVGLAVVAGAVLILMLGQVGQPDLYVGLPTLVMPRPEFSFSAALTISIPMVVLVLGLGNVQGMGYLVGQGYAVPANRITTAVGAMTVVNALFGGHPAAMTRASSAILASPAAGPVEKRYTGALLTMTLATFVAVVAGPVLAIVQALPIAYVTALAALAVLASFEDALAKSFGGGFRFGATVAFVVTLSTFQVAGIPASFWAIVAGIGASLIVERQEILAHWGEHLPVPVVRHPSEPAASGGEKVAA